MSNAIEEHVKPLDDKVSLSNPNSAGESPEPLEGSIPAYRRRAFETRYGSELPINDEQEVKRQDDV